MSSLNVHLRAKTDADLPFMVNSWMRSFRTGSEFALSIPPEIYARQHSQIVKNLIANSFSIVACNPEDHDQIFGYAVFQPTTARIAVLHWLYVKEVYRRMGIAGAIWREALSIAEHDLQSPAAATHLTRSFSWLGPKWNLVHNPYLIRSSYEADSSQQHTFYQ